MDNSFAVLRLQHEVNAETPTFGGQAHQGGT